MSTTRLVGLLNVHVRARCPSRGWYAKEPHDKGEKAVGFMVSTTTGTEGGGVKGLKNRISLAYGSFGGTRSVHVHVLDCPCPGMVLTVCSRAALRHDTVSPTHPEPYRGNRGNTAGREASWLKQVRKVKRVEESEKWVTRPRGGEVKKLW